MGRHSKQSKVNKAISATTLTGIGITGMALVASATPAEASPDWGPVIGCESGGNPTATNPSSSASGLFQFLDTTWQGLGGKGRAKDNSVAKQYELANKQYGYSGFTAWEASRSCWGGKIKSSGPAYVAPAAPRHAAPVAPAPRHAAPAPESAPKHAAGPGKHYVVKSGDCLSRIASDHTAGSWATLYAVNRAVVGSDPNLIFPGQDLVLPS
jgi:hypothetical protein